jgi:hypothetical protein
MGRSGNFLCSFDGDNFLRRISSLRNPFEKFSSIKITNSNNGLNSSSLFQPLGIGSESRLNGTKGNLLNQQGFDVGKACLVMEFPMETGKSLEKQPSSIIFIS